MIIIVRGRLVEAADTFKHLYVSGLKPKSTGSFWPEIAPEYKEVEARYRPDAAAISRAEEVYHRWMLTLIPVDARRIVLGQWAACMVGASKFGSFRNFCNKTQPNRRTPQRWVDDEIQRIAEHFLKIPQSLHEPEWGRVSPMLRLSDSDLDTLRRRSFERSEDAVPGHDSSPESIAEITKHIAKSNQRARKEQERRREREAGRPEAA